MAAASMSPANAIADDDDEQRRAFVKSKLRDERLDQRRQQFKEAVRLNRHALRRATRHFSLHPASRWVRLWDFLFVVPALVWIALAIPLEVGFCALSFDLLKRSWSFLCAICRSG